MKLSVGMRASSQRSFTLEEVKFYCACSIDTNPIHYDAEVGRAAGFEGVIVPGLLVSSLFGGLMGSVLPGFGTVHLHQEVSFLKPVHTGEMVTAELTVAHIRYDKPIVTFDCIAYKANGEIAVKGKGVVKVPQKYL